MAVGRSDGRTGVFLDEVKKIKKSSVVITTVPISGLECNKVHGREVRGALEVAK